MEETTCNSPESRSDENSHINEPDTEASCKNDNDTERCNGERTPQHSERSIDNSIFNTISKIVNPTTKVNFLSFCFFLSFPSRADFYDKLMIFGRS